MKRSEKRILTTHVADAPLEEMVDPVFRVRAGAYSIEAANVRHEHEWRVWEGAGLPAGKTLSVRFARLVGRENVMAGTDCGFTLSESMGAYAGVMWNKFQSLVESAWPASEELWQK